MIKTFLKHCIYEICIEQVFLGIVINFSKVPTLKIWDLLKLRREFNMIHYLDEDGLDRVFLNTVVLEMLGVVNGSPMVKILHKGFYTALETETGSEVCILDVDRIVGIA